MAVIPQQLFSSAAACYARYRTGYPPQDVAALAHRLGLDHTQTVIDVGCGTGQLAIPMAQHARSVIAIDPVAEMLSLGRQAAQAAHTDNITWLLGDSSDLDTLVAPGARVATFAASFHWTDRPAVLRVLDRLLEPTGSIVTINDDLSDAERPDWDRAITELRAHYLGDDHTAATAPYTDPAEGHRAVLSNSPFSDIQGVTWHWTRQLTVQDAVGLQFTYSFSTPALFADRAAAFAKDARAAILALHPSGWVTEPFRVQVLIAFRPQP